MRSVRIVLSLAAAVVAVSRSSAQRIQTVEVGESRYFISNVSPYSPTLNWFLAYEYCRNIGMELLALEKSEETELISTFLSDNNYISADYWTSGNQLGSDLWLWMSTGQPFNSTFNYWAAEGAPLTKSQQSCMSTQNRIWSPNNCMDSKAFICEQTRCFYYNYVTTRRVSSQGNSTILPGITSVTNRPQLNRRPTRLPIHTSIRPSQANTDSVKEQAQLNTTANPQTSITQAPQFLAMSDLSTLPFTTDSMNPSAILKLMTTKASSQVSKIITTTEQAKIMPTPEQAKTMPTPEQATKSMTTTEQAKTMPTPEQTTKSMTTTEQAKTMTTTEQTKTMPAKGQVKTMPTTQQVKTMSTTSSPQVKIMPTENPEQVKVMPENGQQHIKVMPTELPTINDSSINTANNEIVPTDPNFLLRLLQPPMQDFTPGEPKADTARGVNIMEILSRKETFSWALEDGTSQ